MPRKSLRGEKSRIKRLDKSLDAKPDVRKLRMENASVYSKDFSSDREFLDELRRILRSDSPMTKTLLYKQKKKEVKTRGVPKKVSQKGEQNKQWSKPLDTKPQWSKPLDTKPQCSKVEMETQDHINNVLQEFGDDGVKSLVSKRKKINEDVQEQVKRLKQQRMEESIVQYGQQLEDFQKTFDTFSKDLDDFKQNYEGFLVDLQQYVAEKLKQMEMEMEDSD